MNYLMTDNQKKYITYIIIALFALLFHFLFSRLNIVGSDSIDGTLYWVDKKSNFGKGDYVTFDYTDSLVKDSVKLSKKIACVSGDTLTTKGMSHYCNGILISTALIENKNGTKLPFFEFDGVIPDALYFVVGDNTYSYDSRYFGFITEGNNPFLIKRIF